jgi:hypothetical protein
MSDVLPCRKWPTLFFPCLDLELYSRGLCPNFDVSTDGPSNALSIRHSNNSWLISGWQCSDQFLRLRIRLNSLQRCTVKYWRGTIVGSMARLRLLSSSSTAFLLCWPRGWFSHFLLEWSQWYVARQWPVALNDKIISCSQCSKLLRRWN